MISDDINVSSQEKLSARKRFIEKEKTSMMYLRARGTCARGWCSGDRERSLSRRTTSVLRRLKRIFALIFASKSSTVKEPLANTRISPLPVLYYSHAV